MKTIVAICILFLTFGGMMAQGNALKMTHLDSEKEVIVKANKRVVVHTIDGLKIKGRLKIRDDKSIMLNGRPILLSNISKIQRNPLLLSIVVDGIAIYFGAAALGIGVIVATFGGAGAAAALFAIPAAALIYAGIKSPKFTKGYKSYKGWTYEVVPPPLSS